MLGINKKGCKKVSFKGKLWGEKKGHRGEKEGRFPLNGITERPAGWLFQRFSGEGKGGGGCRR